MKLVLASRNPHKLAEFSRILSPLGIRMLSQEEVCSGMNDVEETGETFLDNACIKAMAVYEACGFPVVADDSGLVVEALGGRPGVHSARYGGKEMSHTEKIRLLLQELEQSGSEDRTAHFVCAICCVLGDGDVLTCEGRCTGEIGMAPEGESGFGYDPVFFVKGKSFGQMSETEKDAMSHRGVALRDLYRQLQERIR